MTNESSTIVLSREAATAIHEEAPASADGRETGGLLLGHDLGAEIAVTVAGDPGPDADRRTDGFLRDRRHAECLADQAYDRDGSVWIGEWHTHPGGLPGPSSTDMDTYARLLADSELGFERIVSLVVTCCAVHGWAEVIIHGWIVIGSGALAVPVAVVDGDVQRRQGEGL